MHWRRRRGRRRDWVGPGPLATTSLIESGGGRAQGGLPRHAPRFAAPLLLPVPFLETSFSSPPSLSPSLPFSVRWHLACTK